MRTSTNAYNLKTLAILEQDLHSDYAQRLNKVFLYIDAHLDADLTLEILSKIAFFSPFHFHRVFKTLTGETLHKYIVRRRIEKAAASLIHQPHLNIQTIGLHFGFSSLDTFSRSFKKFYEVSPSAFRALHPHKYAKIRPLINSKNGQAYPEYQEYLSGINNLKQWLDMTATSIAIKTLPEMELAYASCIGLENLGPTYETLVSWATKHKHLHASSKMLTRYYDSLKITEPEKMRMDASLVLEAPIDLPPFLTHATMLPGKCIVGHFEIGLEAFESAWSSLFIWMNDEGYSKRTDAPPFGIYYNDYKTHPEQKCIADLCIPIV